MWPRHGTTPPQNPCRLPAAAIFLVALLGLLATSFVGSLQGVARGLELPRSADLGPYRVPEDPPPTELEEPPPSAPHEEATTADLEPPARPSLREICRQEPTHDDADALDESRRIMAETFCGATLWIDGLLGGTPDVRQAQEVYGHVQLGTIYTEFDEFDFNGRLRVHYDFPNLERRLRLFLGREADQDFIADRQQVPAIRSSVFGLEGEDRWLAGLGYSPPGRFSRKLDFRVGGRVRRTPEVFTQVRYRHHFFRGEDAVWRLRETLFWASEEGLGFTTSADYDRVLRPDLLMRWGNVGTLSESTEGFDWRSAVLLYLNLRNSRALAGELFTRGATDAEVMVREYGARAIYRQPLGRPYLFGELILGYTWPREERHQHREGSTMVGFGIELRFGQEPGAGS